MAKVKKVSISSLDKIIKSTYQPVTEVAWQDVVMTVKQNLSFTEMMRFVDSVVKSCFSIDDNTYIPEVKSFAIKSCLVEMYTNVSLPENIEHKHDILYQSDIVPVVLQNIDMEQYTEILNAIDAKVEHMAQANIESINKQMNELYAAFDNVQKQLSGVFSGVGAGEISKMVGAISDGKFDESKLVKAYLANGDTQKTKPNPKRVSNKKDSE